MSGSGVAGDSSAQAAIVYESDAAAARSATLALVVSDSRAPRIVYPAAVTKAARNAAAARRAAIRHHLGGEKRLADGGLVPARRRTLRSKA